MVTKTIKTRPAIFPIGPLPSPREASYTRLNDDEVFHRAAAGAPGYDDIVALFERLDIPAPDSRVLGEPEEEVFDRILAGGDPIELTSDYLQEEERRKVVFAAREFALRAVPRASQKSMTWLESDRVQAHLAGELQADLDRILKALRADAVVVGSARTFDEASQVPETAAALSSFHRSARELAAVRRTIEIAAGLVVQSEREADAMWPMMAFIKDYMTAWPAFWLRRPLHITSPGYIDGETVRRTPWWSELSDIDLAFAIVDRDVALWAPTRQQLVRQKRIVDLETAGRRAYVDTNEWVAAARDANQRGVSHNLESVVRANYTAYVRAVETKVTQNQSVSLQEARVLAESLGVQSAGFHYDVVARIRTQLAGTKKPAARAS